MECWAIAACAPAGWLAFRATPAKPGGAPRALLAGDMVDALEK